MADSAVSSRYLLFALLARLVGGGIGLLVGFLASRHSCWW